MALFADFGIMWINHYSPLHYLPFIARSRRLLPKHELKKSGFNDEHFRSKSNRHDVARGFANCAFLTIDPSPRILKAKLKAGFPHIAIRVPSEAVESHDFSLCRYNIAMTRVLKRDGLPGRPESSTNGRYYDQQQVPVAREHADKQAMLEEHLPRGTMIEVLVHQPLRLPKETAVICYSETDVTRVQSVLASTGTLWEVNLEEPPGPYIECTHYADEVDAFIERALFEPDWRGNGLEFDHV